MFGMKKLIERFYTHRSNKKIIKLYRMVRRDLYRRKQNSRYYDMCGFVHTYIYIPMSEEEYTTLKKLCNSEEIIISTWRNNLPAFYFFELNARSVH